MKKHLRISKKQKAQDAISKKYPELMHNHLATDRNIFDLVLKMLFENSDKNALSLEKEIFEPFKIKMSRKEQERVWDVLINSGFVNPIVGFGNAGKIGLSQTGYQIMTQYGTYSNFIESSQQGRQQQPIVLQLSQHQPEPPAAEAPKAPTPTPAPVPPPPPATRQNGENDLGVEG
ncbi:hypothetical protein [Taibaiella soli]|uniref:Uncharacterized protein n=1 Tax=Taibaiella soli TaxID=1649169 RepID=A0A2W2AXU8_9BACT|nr:hypothetical protein [Taibaiella soli]PZF72508.1 hypothetical protein DN068_11625 [Taibaiella soli]